jgi:hypothetical protein
MPNTRDNVTWEHKTNVKASGLFVQTAPIAFNDAAKALMTIPVGASILSIDVIVTTGFDGTTPTYDIGYAGGDADALVDGGSLSATAGRSMFIAPAATAAQWNETSSGSLIGTFVGGGTNTAGAGRLRVAYFVAP